VVPRTRIHGERVVAIGLETENLEVFRHDAEHFGGRTVETHDPSNDCGIAAEVPHPCLMRQNDHARAAGPRFCL
jgi:hypothetical protein